MAEDAGVREQFRRAKRTAKVQFAEWLQRSSGVSIDPESLFDSQIKRIHEYKRQLLNVLHIVMLYNRLRRDPGADVAPRTFFFAGKAAPAYQFAKLVIRLINSVAATIDRDPRVRDRLRVLFLPDYNVSLAERLIPASNVSEQISTAGFEASGTGNMKFMMNGALTVGTRDGATIEMAEQAGEQNLFLFGLSAWEVVESRSWYDPTWHYRNDAEIGEAIDLLFSDHFGGGAHDTFAPIRGRLLEEGDYYMHLADLRSYSDAQAKISTLWHDPDAWAAKAILNVAASGHFSSDRTIAEYAADVWHTRPCPVP
jgi:starch phosphorylase